MNKKCITILLLIILILASSFSLGKMEEGEELFLLKENLIMLQVQLGLMEEEKGKDLLELLYYQRERGLYYSFFPYYLEGVWLYFPNWPTQEEMFSSLQKYQKALEILKESLKEGLSTEVNLD